MSSAVEVTWTFGALGRIRGRYNQVKGCAAAVDLQQPDGPMKAVTCRHVRRTA